MLKKRTILSFYQCASCRTLAIELVRQNANSTYLSKQSGHKEPSWPSGIRAAGLIWNTLSAKSWLPLITNVRLLYHTSAVILLWCINFRFNNYSIHDNAWHCIQYQYRWWWCSRVKCRPITFGAAHPSLRWAATCHVRTLLPGPEGVRSWQVLLYSNQCNDCLNLEFGVNPWWQIIRGGRSMQKNLDNTNTISDTSLGKTAVIS